MFIPIVLIDKDSDECRQPRRSRKRDLLKRVMSSSHHRSNTIEASDSERNLDSPTRDAKSIVSEFPLNFPLCFSDLFCALCQAIRYIFKFTHQTNSFHMMDVYIVCCARSYRHFRAFGSFVALKIQYQIMIWDALGYSSFLLSFSIPEKKTRFWTNAKQSNPVFCRFAMQKMKLNKVLLWWFIKAASSFSMKFPIHHWIASSKLIHENVKVVFENSNTRRDLVGIFNRTQQTNLPSWNGSFSAICTISRENKWLLSRSPHASHCCQLQAALKQKLHFGKTVDSGLSTIWCCLKIKMSKSSSRWHLNVPSWRYYLCMIEVQLKWKRYTCCFQLRMNE